ncbi:MAG: protein kinase [bacterium]|nr:protein kinase [bacterium]
MKCPKCGSLSVADAKFCKACGEDLIPTPSGEITERTDRQLLAQMNKNLIKGRFKIIRKLGKGGMGEVVLAEDIKLKRKVAIKSILTDSLVDNTSKARFLREAQTASQLDHPNICTVYEVYDEQDHDHIVMQYVDGVTVDQILKVKTLGVDKALDIAIQLCSAMIEANEKNIIHRDIKPGNIMVDRNGVVKILDFGLAKFQNEAFLKKNEKNNSNLTEKGIVLGTVSYLSPEQASGKPLDLRTDIFSFGVLMCEMLEGENPFKEEEQIETLYNVLNKNVVLSKKIPEKLRRIIYKSLEKEKKNRYADFSQLRNELSEFRSTYAQSKAQSESSPGTEVIDYRIEKNLVQEIQKVSDREELGELVYKIKKFKAYTEKVYSTRAGKKAAKWIMLPIILTAILVGGYFAAIHYLQEQNGNGIVAKPKGQFYVFLHPLKNKTREKGLSEKLNYLLTESLNQFEEFKVINRSEAASILGLSQTENVDLKKLAKKFKIQFILKGVIKKEANNYTLEGSLIPVDKHKKRSSLTFVGKGKDSFLIHQVDSFTKRVYRVFFPGKNFHDIGLKKFSKIYGSKWTVFENFYKGYSYKNKMDPRAKKYLMEAGGLVISQYYLADLFYFEDMRSRAVKRIKEIVPTKLHLLTEPMKCRVLALEARLNYDFKKEIENLEKLKMDLSFSKETFYELGEAYFHRANPEKAIEYFKKALNLDSDYSKALNHLGYCYSHLGKHAKAIDVLEEYKTLDESANSYDSLGDGYFFAGELLNSESFKEMALSKDEKGLYWAYLILADIDILKARFQKAEAELKKYSKLMPSKKSTADILAKKAYIYLLKKDYQKALKTIEQSLKSFDSLDIKENSAEAHWLKGLILLALEQDDEALLEADWLEELVGKYKLSKDNFLIPYKYFVHLDALCLEKAGKIEDAEIRFKYLMEMKNSLSYWTTYYNYQFFHTEYVKFLVRIGKNEDALSEAEKCLDFNRNYIPVLWEKVELLEKLERGADERIALYDRMAELYGESKEKNNFRARLKEKFK